MRSNMKIKFRKAFALTQANRGSSFHPTIGLWDCLGGKWCLFLLFLHAATVSSRMHTLRWHFMALGKMTGARTFACLRTHKRHFSFSRQTQMHAASERRTALLPYYKFYCTTASISTLWQSAHTHSLKNDNAAGRSFGWIYMQRSWMPVHACVLCGHRAWLK